MADASSQSWTKDRQRREQAIAKLKAALEKARREHDSIARTIVRRPMEGKSSRSGFGGCVEVDQQSKRVYDRRMKAESRVHRLRAIQCEHRAAAVSEPHLKGEWEELAIEWHLLANAIGKASGEDSQAKLF